MGFRKETRIKIGYYKPCKITREELEKFGMSPFLYKILAATAGPPPTKGTPLFVRQVIGSIEF
jgi:hypothetical protein